MNSHDLQQTLLKTTKILAGEEVQVFMEGFQPRVEYDPKTKKPTRIFIPALPEGTPEDLVAAIHGYIDHECSHIMFSDSDDICDTSKSKLWHYVHNCIEDPRVNKAIGDFYLGSTKNIRAGYSYLFNKRENEDGTPTAYNKDSVDALDFTDDKLMAEMQMRYSSLWFANRMGDTLSGDKYKELDLDRVFAPLEAKMDKRWLDQLKRVNSANDVKNLSEYFEGFFSKEALDKMDPSKGGTGSGSGDGDEEDGKSGKKRGAGATGDPFKTLEDELGEAIKQEIEYNALESKSGFYWTDRWDKTLDKREILKSMSSRIEKCKTVSAFEEEVKSVTNYLTKDLRRLLEERRRRYYIGGFRRGKLNTKALYSVKMGNDRVFKKRNEVRDINAAVSLLIDMSGSMNGEKVYVAFQCAYAFAMVLDAVGVSYEIYGFSTENGDHNMNTEWNKFKSTISKETAERCVNSFSPEVFYAFKRFNEPFDLVTKTAIVGAAHSCARMNQNEDSKHVMKALERVSSRPERQRSLFVFSDGMPAYHTEVPKNGHNALKYYGHNAKDQYGVDVYSIGIQSNSVSNFYENFKVLSKLPELPAALFEFLRKAI